METKLTNDIVSTIAEDKPLIYISEEAINLKSDNDKLKDIIKEIKENIEDITSNHFKRYDNEVYKLCDDILKIINKGE